jgi:hypothetical protein
VNIEASGLLSRDQVALLLQSESFVLLMSHWATVPSQLLGKQGRTVCLLCFF